MVQGGSKECRQLNASEIVWWYVRGRLHGAPWHRCMKESRNLGQGVGRPPISECGG